jgi:hypothetical protein
MRMIRKRLIYVLLFSLTLIHYSEGQNISPEFINPPREFSLMPFWFWNDTLKNSEIIRQIEDFENHGVYGFVIHPRIGLPGNTGWLSKEMIKYMHVAIKEAERRHMYVVLYDEGMYPSGSSSGQVVARNPQHAARGFAKIDLKPGQEFVPERNTRFIGIFERPGGERVAVVEKPSGGVIRGIHYIGQGANSISEEKPPAGDILNPEVVESFIDLVYERFYKEFGNYFGNTIIGIFTDEPSPLGRESEPGMVPGNIFLLPEISRIIGYDFGPFLPALWYTDQPDWKKYRTDYYQATNKCLEEIYYKRLNQWCGRHGIALMGHPAGSMDIGAEKYFDVPGQDLVWRYVEPGPKALEGEHSTMAKCASGAMIHLGLRRNSNELYGAYGHNLTFEEMMWLAGWCFVRGQNFLLPHAFYYSVRGPRLDERPPDVGPNAVWWKDFKPFADACRRLSWINTDSRHICEIAILAGPNFLPHKAAKICFQNQRDFNYLELSQLSDDARVDSTGVHIAGMHYKAIILDTLPSVPGKTATILKQLSNHRRLIVYHGSENKISFENSFLAGNEKELLHELDKLAEPDLITEPHTHNLRYRHVVRGNDHYYIIHNEESDSVKAGIFFAAKGKIQWLDLVTAEGIAGEQGERIIFRPYELKLVKVVEIKE